jgi:hypothetical protein
LAAVAVVVVAVELIETVRVALIMLAAAVVVAGEELLEAWPGQQGRPLVALPPILPAQ